MSDLEQIDQRLAEMARLDRSSVDADERKRLNAEEHLLRRQRNALVQESGRPSPVESAPEGWGFLLAQTPDSTPSQEPSTQERRIQRLEEQIRRQQQELASLRSLVFAMGTSLVATQVIVGRPR